MPVIMGLVLAPTAVVRSWLAAIRKTIRVASMMTLRSSARPMPSTRARGDKMKIVFIRYSFL